MVQLINNDFSKVFVVLCSACTKSSS